MSSKRMSAQGRPRVDMMSLPGTSLNGHNVLAGDVLCGDVLAGDLRYSKIRTVGGISEEHR